MPGTFHFDSNASPVTLPPIHAILGSNSSFDPVRSAESLKEPPPVANGYHSAPSIYSSSPRQPNGSTQLRPPYPQYPIVSPQSHSSQSLPYLNAPYAPPRENYRPAPNPPPASQPPPAYGLPALGHPLKASNYPTSISPTHTRGYSDPLEPLDSRGPTRPVSNEQLRSDALSARPPVAARNVVDVRDIPGEGECYVLEDGSVMRTEIAGEKVNPAWGITKAGKPRKRLAKACATCREKKIKCEQGGPGDTKCVQCARLNRPCKIPQDNHGPTADESRPPKRPPPPGNSLLTNRFGNQRLDMSPARQRYEGGIPHQTMNNYHPALDRMESRRNALEEASFQSSALEMPDSQLSLGRKKGKSIHGRKFRQPSLPDNAAIDKFGSRADPYEADPETTMCLLELFFHHRNASPYVIWPRNHFFEWTRNCKTKSPDDLMVLYALMALGSVFCQESGSKEVGDKAYQVAFSLERERANRPSLQMMQARSALLLFNFARGDFEGTFEYTAHAIRTATSMRYTDENRVADIDEDLTRYDFDMNAAQIKECRRRSFYITYFIDRYNSFSYGSMGQIHDIELFLRLPSHDSDYEEGCEVPTATFGGEDVRETHVVEPSAMALLVEITSIWGDVTGNSYRSVNRHQAIYVNYYEDNFRRTKERMRAWVASLPERLKYSRENITKAVQGGYFTDFYVLQAIFHLVGMKLGRTGRVDLLPDHIKRRNLRMARCYALRFLRIVNALAQQVYQAPSDDIDLALSQPFPGYVILNACDVLSAGGKTSHLARMTNGELEDSKLVLEQGGKFWTVNQKQCNAIDDRQGHLSAMSMNNSQGDTMRVKDAIDRSFLPENHDLVYRVDEKLFWDIVMERDIEERDPLAN